MQGSSPVDLVLSVHRPEQSQGVVCDAYLHACDLMLP